MKEVNASLKLQKSFKARYSTLFTCCVISSHHSLTSGKQRVELTATSSFLPQAKILKNTFFL